MTAFNLVRQPNQPRKEIQLSALFNCKQLDFGLFGSSTDNGQDLPGTTGLYSVQGTGSACVRKVEKKMTNTSNLEIKSPPANKARNNLTRQQQLQKLLSRKAGATIVQIQNAFGWQPHSARAAISMMRKAGHTVERSGSDKGTVYRIVKEA